ncbi:VOC family protein [Actinoplanes sp. NBC_00393]|uniref:VOC family protein n=1 Tax=Actinoplanes sp. NBC_00393 TaxID=2975953 RepID=UPI002E1B40E9
MGIQRIESVTYTVDDLDTNVRFFEDFGLTLVSRDETRAVFETRIKQTLHLDATERPDLPAPVENGPTLREIVWGVDTRAELERLAKQAGADRETPDGVLHTVDLTGFGVGLTLARAFDGEHDAPRAANKSGYVNRVNAALETVGQVRPIRMCHVALNIPKAGREEAVAFYTERLEFIPTDVVKPMGVFMRVEGDADQHNFLLCHRPDKAGVNHVSYEVNGFDDVIEGGNHMIEKGWQEARRLGRHTVGSNVFRFVHAPCGGRVELAADMDRIDDSYGTRVHETTPPHHIWTLRTNRESSS